MASSARLAWLDLYRQRGGAPVMIETHVANTFFRAGAARASEWFTRDTNYVNSLVAPAFLSSQATRTGSACGAREGAARANVWHN